MKFIKMHGAGNDFVIVRSDESSFDKDWVKKVCHRNFGVGCDQFIVMRYVKRDSCIMDIYNQDGSRSGACGNATRCVAYLLESKTSTIQVGDRQLKASVDGDYVSIDMGSFKMDAEDIEIEGYKGRYIEVGNPHFVMFFDDIDALNLNEIAPKIQANKKFPESVNVNFAQIVSANEIKLRVFERGTGETLSCGTGSCASSVVSHIVKGLDKVVKVRLRGGDIDITISGNNMSMGGKVSYVFEGEIV
jgi:diaminopimelate epimerase